MRLFSAFTMEDLVKESISKASQARRRNFPPQLVTSLMTVSSIDHITDILKSRSQMEQTDYVLSSVTRSLMH